MQVIIDFFAGIGDAVTSAFQWFAGFIEDTVYFVQLLGEAVAKIPGYFAWIPAEALVVLLVLVGVIVVCRILGREG